MTLVTLVWLALGAVLGGGFVAFARWRGRPREMRIFAVGLVVAAAIYVAFAARGVPPGRMGTEMMGLLGFFVLAAAGARRWPLLLAVGWTVHVVWDVAHLRDAAFVPAAYPLLCITFDLVVAAYVMTRVRSGHAMRATGAFG